MMNISPVKMNAPQNFRAHCKELDGIKTEALRLKPHFAQKSIKKIDELFPDTTLEVIGNKCYLPENTICKGSKRLLLAESLNFNPVIILANMATRLNIYNSKDFREKIQNETNNQ